MTFIDTILGIVVICGFLIIVICKLTGKTPTELFVKFKETKERIEEKARDKGNVIGGIRYG